MTMRARNTLSAARAYAEASFRWASQRNTLSEWATFLAYWSQQEERHQFAELKQHQDQLSSDRLTDLLVEAIGRSVPLDAEQKGFIRLLAEANRWTLISDIWSFFESFLDQASERTAIKCTTPAPLSEEAQAKVLAAFIRKWRGAVRVTWQVDASLFSGMILETKDWVFDYSARGRLAELNTTLRNSLH